MHNKY